MPPETQSVVWTLWTIVAVLAFLVVAMGAVIWGRIVKRPEEVSAAAQDGIKEVHAAARDGDETLSRRIDEMAEKVQRVLTEIALVVQAVGGLKREMKQWRNDFHEMQTQVNENRADIAVIGGSVAMIMENMEMTPIRMPQRRTRPTVVHADDDDDEGPNGNGG